MNIYDRIELLELLDHLITESTVVHNGILVIDAAKFQAEVNILLLEAKQVAEDMYSADVEDSDIPF